ncbi:hypothetical protein BC834DRAFT_958804 [Gloeopeniophorella convolvens]|nr:hypothetical protein BC834DRAFT_958804 [Gloeopeniophorella convolvens]
MFSRVIVPTLLLSAAYVALADPTPSEPSPGEVFNSGGTCHIAWTPDPTGTWKTMNIELMTGDNFQMVHLTTVATVDGTVEPGTFDYPCPDVTLHAAAYFYQFTSAVSTNKSWTGRFAIADANGGTVPLPNATQPGGQPIPWGTGQLTDPSKANPPPSYLTGGSASAPGSSASSLSAPPTSAPPSSSAAPPTTPAAPASSSASPPASSGAAANGSAPAANQADGALALGAVSTRGVQAGVALAVIASAFTFMF